MADIFNWFIELNLWVIAYDSNLTFDTKVESSTVDWPQNGIEVNVYVP